MQNILLMLNVKKRGLIKRENGFNFLKMIFCLASPTTTPISSPKKTAPKRKSPPTKSSSPKSIHFPLFFLYSFYSIVIFFIFLCSNENKSDDQRSRSSRSNLTVRFLLPRVRRRWSWWGVGLHVESNKHREKQQQILSYSIVERRQRFEILFLVSLGPRCDAIVDICVFISKNQFFSSILTKKSPNNTYI